MKRDLILCFEELSTFQKNYLWVQRIYLVFVSASTIFNCKEKLLKTDDNFRK